MPAPIRNRQSCDRCHSQKLKCPKQEGSATCTRCMKAGAVCVFSPPGGGSASASRKDGNPLSPPDPGNMRSSTGIDGSDLPAAFDWSFLQPNFGLPDPSAFSNPGGHSGQAGPSYAAAGGPGPDPAWRPEDAAKTGNHKPSPPNSKSQCIQQLTSMILDLDAVWVSLPPKSDLHFPLDENLEEYTTAFDEKYSQHKSLETLFGTFQRLVDLYPVAIPLSLALNTAEPSQCQPDVCVHSVDPPPNLRAVQDFVVSRNSLSTIDHSLASLLIACHLRLIDVLDHFLLLVLSCFKLQAASPRKLEPKFGVPELRVGSFTPNRASAAFMQAFLIKHLVGSLSDKVDDLVEAVETKSQGNPDRECQVLALQCEILRERQATKVEQIGELSEALAQAGMMK